MDNNITAYAWTEECGEIQVPQVKALDFHLWFIDRVAGLLDKSSKPSISVSLFNRKQVPGLSVAIVPVDISDIAFTSSNKTFLFRLHLFTPETGIEAAYAELLNLIRIADAVLASIAKTKSLTIVKRLSILNENEATLNLTVQKFI